MIIFPHTRKRRLSVQLVELTLGEGIALAKLPAGRNEMTTTELLKCAAKKADQPRPTFVTNPLLWTVEERTLLVCLYLAQVSPDGPDFAIGRDGAVMSNYVDLDRDSTMEETDLGEVINKALVMRPLLGLHAQALELICHSRGDWVVGAMACQVFQKAEAAIDWAGMTEVEVQAWVKEKSEKFYSLPESDFDKLYAAYLAGAERLSHFVRYTFDDDGLVFEAKGGGDVQHPPARFLADSCISDISRSLS